MLDEGPPVKIIYKNERHFIPLFMKSLPFSGASCLAYQLFYFVQSSFATPITQFQKRTVLVYNFYYWSARIIYLFHYIFVEIVILNQSNLVSRLLDAILVA